MVIGNFYIFLDYFVCIFLVSNVMTLSEYEWIQIAISIVSLIVAISLFSVAYSSLQNAKKERKQRYLETQLKEVYTPLYEIFVNAKKTERGRREHKPSFKFISNELDEIRTIYHKFSHYLENNLSKEIRKEIIEDKECWVSRNRKLEFIGELDKAFVYIETKYCSLKKELEDLNK